MSYQIINTKTKEVWKTPKGKSIWSKPGHAKNAWIPPTNKIDHLLSVAEIYYKNNLTDKITPEYLLKHDLRVSEQDCEILRRWFAHAPHHHSRKIYFRDFNKFSFSGYPEYKVVDVVEESSTKAVDDVIRYFIENGFNKETVSKMCKKYNLEGCK